MRVTVDRLMPSYSGGKGKAAPPKAAKPTPKAKRNKGRGPIARPVNPSVGPRPK